MNEKDVLTKEQKDKLNELRKIIGELGSLAVGFSGGADSALLLAVAHEVLGERSLAVTAADASVPKREISEAKKFCDRKETYDADTNPNGRWRRFTEADIKAREDLNFKWIDFTEEDDRSVGEILDEMQEEADGISAAVAQLKELLGGIEL